MKNSVDGRIRRRGGEGRTTGRKREDPSMDHQRAPSPSAAEGACRDRVGGGGPLASLDADQLVSILEHLPVRSIVSVGMTCHRLREVADSDALWSEVCQREWGSGGSGANGTASKKGGGSGGWKRVYRQMACLSSIAWRKLPVQVQAQMQTQREEEGVVAVGPAPRASHSMCALPQGSIVVFGGGCDGGRHLDDTWVASAPGGHVSEGVIWRQVCEGTPSGRFGHSCNVSRDGVLVLFGGINDRGIRQCDTWVSRDLDNATSSSSINSSSSSSSSSGGSIVEGGGVGLTWQPLVVPDPPPPARGAHSGCYGGDGRVVMYGGIGSDGTRLGDTWVLDLLGAPAWRQVATARSPPARSGHTLTWIGGRRMLLFGGRGSGFEVLNDTWLLDMEDGESPQWTEWASACDCPPPPRAGHSATLIFGGRVLIYGGEDARRSRKGDIWVLDPQGERSVGVGGGGGGGYLGGGTVSGQLWKRLKPRGPSPGKRSFHSACATDSGRAVVIFGGMVDNSGLKPGAGMGFGFDAELFLLQLVP